MAARKLVTILIMSLVLALVMAACGSNNGKNNSASSSPTPAASSSAAAESSAPEQSPAGAGSDKSFTIRVGAWFIDDRTYQQNFKAAIEEDFKKLYPNGKIQWDITLGATYFEKLTAQFASKSAPDVVFYQNLTEYAKAGYLEDLSNEPWVARLADSARKDSAVNYGGTIYGLSMGGQLGGGIWYNTKIFENLGLQVPTTNAEFMDVLEKIKQAGITPIALGFKDLWTVNLFLASWVQSYGFAQDGDYGVKLYNGEIPITEDPALHAVLTNLQTLKEKGYINKNALSIDWPQSAQLFASGEAAMIIQGPWMPGANKENIANGGYEPFQIGFMPFANDEGDKFIRVSTSTSVGVSADSELIEEAKAMVNLIAQEHIYSPFLSGEGSLSSLTDINATYEDSSMNTVMEYVNQNALPYNLENFLPASAMTSIVELATKVVSGAKFDPKDLKAASDNLEKDKASVVLPQ